MKTTTVEERLTRIERKFDELKHEVLSLKPLAKFGEEGSHAKARRREEFSET